MEQDGIVSLIENRRLTSDEVGLLASLITDEPDHYTVLGVDRTASSEDIQAAYCLAVEYFHPLKSRKITESDSVMHWKLSSAFSRIEDAFTVLSSPGRRKIYDDKLSSEANGSEQPWYRRPVSCEPAPEVRAKGYAGNESHRRTNELRRVERVRLNLPLRVTLDRHWQELTHTLDVSPLGVRFRLSRQLESGSELRLELPMPRRLRTHSYDDELYVVSAFVLYASNDESGRHVAAEFI